MLLASDWAAMQPNHSANPDFRKAMTCLTNTLIEKGFRHLLNPEILKVGWLHACHISQADRSGTGMRADHGADRSQDLFNGMEQG